MDLAAELAGADARHEHDPIVVIAPAASVARKPTPRSGKVDRGVGVGE